MDDHSARIGYVIQASASLLQIGACVGSLFIFTGGQDYYVFFAFLTTPIVYFGSGTLAGSYFSQRWHVFIGSLYAAWAPFAVFVLLVAALNVRLWSFPEIILPSLVLLNAVAAFTISYLVTRVGE